MLKVSGHVLADSLCDKGLLFCLVFLVSFIFFFTFLSQRFCFFLSFSNILLFMCVSFSKVLFFVFLKYSFVCVCVCGCVSFSNTIFLSYVCIRFFLFSLSLFWTDFLSIRENGWVSSCSARVPYSV